MRRKEEREKRRAKSRHEKREREKQKVKVVCDYEGGGETVKGMKRMRSKI